MKLIPTANILICGVHSPAGVPTEAPDRVARELIAQRLARVFFPAPEVAAVQPVIETAAVQPTKPARKLASRK